MKKINSINKVSSNSSISDVINNNNSITLTPLENEINSISASLVVSKETFLEFDNDPSFKDFIKEKLINKLVKELLSYTDVEFEEHSSDSPEEVVVTARLKIRNRDLISPDLDKLYCKIDLDKFYPKIEPNKFLDKMNNWKGVNNY